MLIFECMECIKFFSHVLIFHFICMSIFLFISCIVVKMFIKIPDIERKVAMLVQGIIFTGLTLIVLYVLKRKSPGSFRSIGVKGVTFSCKMAIRIAILFILLVVGIFTAYIVGGIDNLSLNLTRSVGISILVNIITAFMYEAFPEEVFIRGLIVEELRKKFRFFTTLFLQPLIFICVPIAVMAMESIFFHKPFAVAIGYFILLIVFGIASTLYRAYTGYLWMSIIFHLIYLEVTRYIALVGVYESEVALLEFDETFEGFMSLYLSFLFMIILSIVVLSVLILNDKRKTRSNRPL